MKKILNLLLAAILIFNVSAQNIKTEKVTYTYVKLPTNPVKPKPASYYSQIKSGAESINADLKAKYEADLVAAESEYQDATNNYQSNLKAADEQYLKEMEEYNNKSMAKKLVEKQLLNENTKPVKRYVPTPSKKYVPEPKYATAHDVSTLASSYLKLDGFNRAEGSELNYLVTMETFEYSQPKVVSEVKKESTVSNGKSTSYDVTYYHIEFEYRLPMNIKVTRNGSEVYFENPAKLQEFTKYVGSATKSHPSTDVSVMAKNLELQVLKENLNYINHLVNDRLGFENTERKTGIDYVKDKKGEYADLTEAYNLANAAYNMLGKTDDQAKSKLEQAVALWSKALGESDLLDKKARIDKKVTTSLYFNLLEGYFILRNVDEGEKILNLMNKIDLSRSDAKLRDNYAQEFIDLRMRINANQ
jgi:hypothetical protein